MQLEILTPEEAVFKGEVESVTLPGTVGSFQVLDNHAPLVSTLEPGRVYIRTYEGRVQEFAIGRGFVEVLDNHVVVMV